MSHEDVEISRLQGELAAQRDHNARLITTLREARDQIVSLKTEVDRLAEPPGGFGTFLTAHQDSTADIMVMGKKVRVALSPEVDRSLLTLGREVLLN